MKRIVFLFIFCIITLILAEWAAVNEITRRIKERFKKNNDIR